ncbi:hypothetical protein PG984_005487 [Apiospora sp. TS-2023a]
MHTATTQNSPTVSHKVPHPASLEILLLTNTTISIKAAKRKHNGGMPSTLDTLLEPERDRFQIIIVHGSRWSYLGESLEQTVKNAAVGKGNEAPRLLRYKFDGNDVAVFNLIKWQRPQTGLHKASRILFIADGIATSLVKLFMTDCIDEAKQHPLNTETWLSIIQGCIFKSTKSHHARQYAPDYEELLSQEWSALQKSDSVFEKKGAEDVNVKCLDLAKRGIKLLMERLLVIDYNFTSIFESEFLSISDSRVTNQKLRVIKENIYVLQPDISQTSGDPVARDPQSANNAHDSGLSGTETDDSGLLELFDRSTRTLKGRWKAWVRSSRKKQHQAIDTKIINTIIQMIGYTHATTREFRSLKQTLSDYQYFEIDTSTDVSQPVEMRGSDSPTPELPQRVETIPLDITTPEHLFLHHMFNSPRERTITDSMDASQEPQGPMDAIIKRSESAHFYFQNCSFKNATALYESCIKMAHQLEFQESSIVFRSRMQLAVIKIMRGHYQDAIFDLKSLNAEFEKEPHCTQTVIAAEISYHHAVALVRLGNFTEAVNLLKTLRFKEASSTIQAVEEMNLRVNQNRLLALAHAYLATLEVVSGTSSGKDPRGRSPLSGLEAAVGLTEVQFLLIQGKAKEGLILVERLIVVTEQTFGASHLLTLEARLVRCHLLTETGQLVQAKARCEETIGLMARYLDRDHTLILEVTSVLVDLHRLNACPSEAFKTSKNLTSRSKHIHGTINHQSLRYEFQMAALNLWIGNHVNGLTQLEDITSKSREFWGNDHPWSLECAVEYSIALSSSGRSGECKRRLEELLRIQCRLFELDIDDREKDKFINNLTKYILSVSEKNRESTKPSFILLRAFSAWAKNELTRSGAEHHQVLQAQVAILQIRKLSPSFQSGHLATLQAGLDLANTLRVDENPMISQMAQSHYSEVIESGATLHDHPIVLLAQQGQFLSKMVHFPDEITQEDTEQFLKVPKLMSLRLGEQHPDTLQALLTAFPAACSINDIRGAEMSAELRQLLHETEARSQRPIQFIQIEEKLGLIHYNMGNKTEAAQVFAALAQSLRSGEAEELNKFDEGKEINRRLNQEVSKIVGEVLDEQWQKAEQAKHNDHLNDAVESLRLFHGLFKAVRGDYEEVTEKVSLNLAEALWRAGQQDSLTCTGSRKQTSRKQQLEAVEILRAIICRMSDGEIVKRRLEEGLEGWEQELASSSLHEPPSPNLSSFTDGSGSISL